MMTTHNSAHLALAACLLCALPAAGQMPPFVKMNDVAWHSLGTNENDSMPLGNGDLALNLWTEQNGDIVLLLAKADAWSENGQLLKLGRVRVKLTPNPFSGGGPFSQDLKLETGEAQIEGGGCRVSVWAEANQPVIHLEVQSRQPLQMEARAELWRTEARHLNQAAVNRAGIFELGSDPDGVTIDPDTVLPAQGNQIAWCHFNSNSIYPLVFEKEHLESLLPKYPDPLLHRCFGVAMSGAGLASVSDTSLKSSAPGHSFRLDLYALTATVESTEAWRTALDKNINSTYRPGLKTARRARRRWWADFWNRSWLHVGGDAEADEVSQGYIMQRYMMACAGRGAQPVKFNGALFTVGHDLPPGATSTEQNHDPDYRRWGNSYWNQNERHLYWPLLASGDFDLLQPWFEMYVRDIPLARDRTRAYFHHDGGAFIETMYFWGLPNLNDFGWNNTGTELDSPWMRYHIQGGLEVLAQMLDEFDMTQDSDFARASLLPLADTVITYYDQHWKRGPDGKILMSPSQSIETYQLNAVDPTPDIAGLKSILPRLLALRQDYIGETEKNLWLRVLTDLPAIPIGTKGGARVILPAHHYGETRNVENPELYAVFPYRLYGMGKPDLELARATFDARRFHMSFCWGQDGLDAALLGRTPAARKTAVEEMTSYGGQWFPWFWKKNNDWIPDMDNGGAGMEVLQLMLMQCDGRRILLLPAWPRDWTADFKLHAPYQTTVAGHVENGKVSGLKVTPVSRAADVEVMPQEYP